MSRLNDATAKLESAIGRMEAAVAAKGASAGKERYDLQATIDQVRQENAALKQSVSNAQVRLDHAIERIRSMLGA